MPLSGALFASVSGLDAMSTAISIVGDNIANVNTTGFKARRPEFADVLGQSIATGGGFSDLGAGSQLANIGSNFNQGTVENTGRALDLAIDGPGFLILEDAQGRYYSRAGILGLDEQGFVTNNIGQRVQGFSIDPITQLSTGQLGDIQVSNALSAPQPTSNVNLSINLAVPAALSGPFDPSTPDATSDYQVSLDVFDSLGNNHSLSLFFTQTSATPNQWTWNATLPAGSTTIAPASPGDAHVVQASGTVEFDNTGKLVLVNGAGTGTANFNLEFSGGAAPGQAVALDFGAVGANAQTTSFAQPGSSTNSATQDGFTAGNLQSLQVDGQGFLVGQFSNGRSLSLAQIALATFPSSEGLRAVGNNNFIEARSSGQPLIGAPQTGNLGSIRGGALEQSNVDLASEFVRLIINQRAFQANTRTISTTNELLGNLVTLGQ